MTTLADRVGTKDIARNKQTLSGKEKGVLGFKYIALIFLTFFAIFFVALLGEAFKLFLTTLVARFGFPSSAAIRASSF